MKHERNIKLTQNSNQVYDRRINALRVFTSLIVSSFFKFNERSIIKILNIKTSLQPPHF
jgi:hypothetical protein